MNMRAIALSAGIAASLALAGCASTPSEPAGPFDRHDFGEPGFVQSITRDVEFYPACGNETLVQGATVWYQYDPANIDDFPNPKRTLETWSGGGGPGALAMVRGAAPAVAAPGPGDDEGVLIVYGGDIAYWQSDSDRLATWLTTHEIEYNWVC